MPPGVLAAVLELPVPAAGGAGAGLRGRGAARGGLGGHRLLPRVWAAQLPVRVRLQRALPDARIPPWVPLHVCGGRLRLNKPTRLDRPSDGA